MKIIQINMFTIRRREKSKKDDEEIHLIEIAPFEDRKMQLLNEISTYEKRIKELEEILTKMNVDIPTMEQRAQEMAKDISSKDAQLASLNIDIEKLKNEIRELTNIQEVYELAISHIEERTSKISKLITLNVRGKKILTTTKVLTNKSTYFRALFTEEVMAKDDLDDIYMDEPSLYMEWYIHYSEYDILPESFPDTQHFRTCKMFTEFVEFCKYYGVEIDFSKISFITSPSVSLCNIQSILQNISNIMFVEYLHKHRYPHMSQFWMTNYSNSTKCTIRAGDDYCLSKDAQKLTDLFFYD